MTPRSPQPSERKALGAFALHTLFLAVLFGMLPFSASYGVAFQALGQALFGEPPGGPEVVGPATRLHVEYDWLAPGDRSTADRRGRTTHRGDGSERVDIEMRGFVGRRSEPVWAVGFSVVDRGYRPSALLLAAILATPATRRRHVLGAIGGLLGLNLFFVAQSGLLAIALFGAVRDDLVPMGSLLAASLPVIEAFFGSPLVRYAAVFAAWAVASNPPRHIDFDGVRARIERLIRGRSAA